MAVVCELIQNEGGHIGSRNLPDCHPWRSVATRSLSRSGPLVNDAGRTTVRVPARSLHGPSTVLATPGAGPGSPLRRESALSCESSVEVAEIACVNEHLT